MSGNGNYSEEKTDPASPKKLQDLRRKGQIPTAQVAGELFGFAAAIGVLSVMIPLLIARAMSGFDTLFAQLHAGAPLDLTGGLRHFLVDLSLPVLFVFAAGSVGTILFKLIAQNGFVFALELVQPKLSHVSPWQGLKRLVKGATLTALLGHMMRFAIFALVCVLLAFLWWDTIINLDLCLPNCAWPVVWRLLLALLITAAALILISVVYDLITQNHFFLQEQKMTKSETKKERKETLGSPELKQERKRIAREVMDTAHVVGSHRAALFFYTDAAVVAFAFHPTKIPLPRVAARAQGVSASQVLRAQLEASGVPGFHDADLVSRAKSYAVGDAAKRDIFVPLATHLRELM